MKIKIYAFAMAAIFSASLLMTSDSVMAQNCCMKATQLHSSNITSHTAQLNFVYSGVANCPPTKFKVRYRITGSNNPWSSVMINANNTNVYAVTISNLQSNTSYSWQVNTNCSGNGAILHSGFTMSQTFTTLMRLGDLNAALSTSSVIAYPNPVHDFLWIEKEMNQPADVSVFITDLMGKQVFLLADHAAEGNFSRQLNIANLPSGIYYLELIANGEKSVSKIVKQ